MIIFFQNYFWWMSACVFLKNNMTVKDHGGQRVVTDVFLWCLAAIYLFAFTSLYVQIPGLYGKDGVLPARNLIHDLTACVDSDERCPMWESWGECKANRYWMSKHCKKSCATCPENCKIEVKDCKTVESKVGQIFLWYQWDALLLETGFLAILIAPWPISLNFKNRMCGFINVGSSEATPSGSVSFWLVKWLLFRLMFSSGVVKLTYMDNTWWGLTALDWHYESQCIPSPLAWYFHHLPEWFQRLSVVMTYVIEIGIPFLFFTPVRSLRLFSCFSQVFLQVLIFITGNYNFFNLLTMVLCLSLLDDKFLGISPSREMNGKQSAEEKVASCEKVSHLSENNGETAPLLNGHDHDAAKKQKPSSNESKACKDAKRVHIFQSVQTFLAGKTWTRVRTCLKVFTILSVAILFFVFTVKWFSLRVTSKEPIQSKTAFTAEEFFPAVRNATYLSMIVGLVSLVVEICKVFIRCFDFESQGERFYQIFKLVLVAGACLFMFSLSLVLYTGEIDREVQKNIPQFLKDINSKTYYLELVHSYGLFRSMTGVGGRPEVVIKGGDTPTGPWKEFDFLYKPGDVDKRPPFVAPHQPRLDWQMWFAALGSYDRNPWFLSLLHKLLLGKPDVLGLLDRGPFALTPPQFIKVDLYRYHYTMNESSFWSALTQSSGRKSWWSREYVSDYTPFIINRNDSKSFESLLQSRFNLLRTDVPDEATSGLLYSAILNLRSSNQGRLGPRLILILFSSSVVLLLTKLWWRKKGHIQLRQHNGM